MNFRSQRVSDLVAAICIPASCLMYLHLMLLGLHDQTPTTHAGPEETLSVVERGASFAAPVAAPSSSLAVPPPLNVTGGAREDLLLMTPILKCGATTMRNLLKALKNRNKFDLVISQPKRAELVHIPQRNLQHDLVGNVSSFTRPTALMQSFAYINFTSHQHQKPIHISLVRSPVERAISWFYHARAPFQLVERHNRFPDTKFPTRKFLKKDLETCLKDRRDKECRYVPGREFLGHTIEFFCGHDAFCPIFGDREGLHRAKQVVEKDFAVVGILEDWNKTMAVLEHYVPRYFKGATDIFHEKLQGDKIMLNENFYKPKVDPMAREFLNRNFTVENEFYDFLRQRLDQQYRALFAPTLSLEP
ncbi:heparan sulfate 2-O-sulfotransferase pipe-like [Penaeus japonicus]|uniref:heparan sulfate 2-O-sulfotransferase pipe-like n=1 Tax=Penaeus japonicus TaxID=27405 RepID=UPI001C715235|nr:heparan sulfate 2-O-sulfotransferase pipe-like [Penaeus japonicus]